MQIKVSWPGRAGLNYSFDVYAMNATWRDVGGVYIFAKPGLAGSWLALYVGVTSSFRQRFSNHERWPTAVRCGATHVHALCEGSPGARAAIESDLIWSLNPPLNAALTPA